MQYPTHCGTKEVIARAGKMNRILQSDWFQEREKFSHCQWNEPYSVSNALFNHDTNLCLLKTTSHFNLQNIPRKKIKNVICRSVLNQRHYVVGGPFG